MFDDKKEDFSYGMYPEHETSRVRKHAAVCDAYFTSNNTVLACIMPGE